MAVEKKLYEALKASAELAALVGDRIYPAQIPQGTELPAVVYHRVSGVPYNHLGAGFGLVRVRIRLDVWALTYDEAQAVNDVLVPAVAAAGGFDKMIENIGSDWGDEKTYRTSVDVICWEKGGFDYE